jgi:hypothetical protein
VGRLALLRQHPGGGNHPTNFPDDQLPPPNSASLQVCSQSYLSVRDGKKSVGAYMMASFSAVMFLNGIWHVAATAYVQTYAPGVATAVLLILPVTIYLLWRAVREGYI